MVFSANLALILLAYLMAGLFTGLLAGLLGLGGGLVMIPVLNSLFAAQGVAPELMQHLTLGTSLAAIVPISLLSARGHAKRGVVDWTVVRRMAPWITAGTVISAILARSFSSTSLQLLYVLLCIWVLFTLLRPLKVVGTGELRPLRLMAPVSAGIGLLSGLLGIGGGSLTTPYLLLHQRDIRSAVGTAAALGVPIAVVGSIAYALAGLGLPGRPASAVGFVDGLAAAGLVVGSLLSTSSGVALAHHLPRPLLQKIFALMVLLGAIKMIWHLLTAT